jgi:choline dehydrogenase-like flavoprotein
MCPADGEQERYTADIVVVACGALSSALLAAALGQRRTSARLANGSGQVGRNYMRHNQSVLMALMREPNETVFQKTLALGDFYFGAADWDYPLGLIQMCASLACRTAQGRGPAVVAGVAAEHAVRQDGAHSMDFWLSSEDLPRPENRIFYDGERVVLDVYGTGAGGAPRLRQKLEHYMKRRRPSRAA